MLKERYDDTGLIIEKYVKALFELPSISKDNHSALRQLLDTVQKHLRALKALKRPTDKWDDLIIHLVTGKLDQLTYREWETTIEQGVLPNFQQLINFLNQRCRALEAASRSSRVTSAPSQEKSIYNKNTAAHVAIAKNACAFCQHESHNIYKCKPGA